MRFMSSASLFRSSFPEPMVVPEADTKLSRPCGSERIGQLWEVVGRCAAGFLPVAVASRLRAMVIEEG
jgi:hypothetical protein